MRISQFARNHKGILIVLAAFGLTQLTAIFSRTLTWDEAVYVSIGKYLFSHGAVGLFEQIRPLLLSLITGVAWFSGFSIASMKILMLVFSIGALGAVYALFNKWIGRNSALIAVIVIAITPAFFAQGTLLLTEIPALLFILLSINFFERQKHFAAGLLAGLAFATKFPAGLAVAVLVLCLFLEKRRTAGYVKLLSGFGVVAIPYAVFNFFYLGSVFKPFLLASLHAKNMAYESSLGVLYYIVAPVLDNLLLAFALPGLFAGRKPRILMLVSAAFLIYLSLLPNKQLRFSILLLPFYAVLSAQGIEYVIRRWKVITLVLLIFLGGLAIAKDVVTMQKKEPYPQKTIDFLNEANVTVILTTDPVPAAYVDKKFIPFYFFIYDEENATTVYEREKTESRLVLFTPNSFACESYGTSCSSMVEDLRKRVARAGIQEFNETVGWQEYLIFKT